MNLSHIKLILDIVVGLATIYGLNGLGIEPRYGRDIPHPSRQAMGLTHSRVQWVWGVSQSKVVRAWR
jgi:hypothetical protein